MTPEKAAEVIARTLLGYDDPVKTEWVLRAIMCCLERDDPTPRVPTLKGFPVIDLIVPDAEKGPKR